MFSRSEIDHLTLNCHVIEYKCITCDWCGHLVTSYFTPRSISFSFLRLQSRFIFTLSEVGTRDGLTLRTYNFETIFFIFSIKENEIIYVLYWNKCWFITNNNRKRFALNIFEGLKSRFYNRLFWYDISPKDWVVRYGPSVGLWKV